MKLLLPDIYRIVYKYIYDCVMNDLIYKYHTKLIHLKYVESHKCCKRIIADCSFKTNIKHWTFLLSNHKNPAKAIRMYWKSDLMCVISSLDPSDLLAC